MSLTERRTPRKPENTTKRNTTMNMTYCRHQNALTDLRDCANDLDERLAGEACSELSQEEFDALCRIISKAQTLVSLIKERGAFEDDQEMSLDEIRNTLAVIDAHACDNNEA